jgi:excisionase family DNA binding protein
MEQDWADYITARQAAIRLGLSRQRVSQLLRQGRIPFKMRDSHYMIKLTDLEAFASIKRSIRYRRPSPGDD